jgi:hypothetical protein
MVYAGLAFAAGFALGVLRVTLVGQIATPLLAVALELPVILALSWVVAGWAIRRHAVARRAGARLAMGMAAFVVLIAAEFALWLALTGGAAGFIARYSTPEGLLGLGGQVLFALIPWARLQTEKTA